MQSRLPDENSIHTASPHASLPDDHDSSAEVPEKGRAYVTHLPGRATAASEKRCKPGITKLN